MKKCCRTCLYYDSGKDDQPCCYCVGYENYEEGDEENDGKKRIRKKTVSSKKQRIF